MHEFSPTGAKVALVTGAARRIGAAIAARLHEDGYRVIVHYQHSADPAAALVDALNTRREDSARAMQADLAEPRALKALAADAPAVFGRIDALVNNASLFRPTPPGGDDHWQALFDVNARAPWRLARALAEPLRQAAGAVVNITDIYAERPLRDHAVYSASKAALASLTRSLAAELAPAVRVNAVAPGAILWPEGDVGAEREALLARTALRRSGSEQDIAGAVSWLLGEAGFVTGQVLRVDGGRALVD